MQDAKRQPVLPKIQQAIEIVALVDMIQLGLSHMLFSLLRYIIVRKGNVYNTNYRDMEMYFSLGLLGLGVVYAVLSMCSRPTRQRFAVLFRRVFRKEAILLALFTGWIVISCISRKTVVRDASLKSIMNAWVLTDTVISLLVLFPLPLLLGPKRGRLLLEGFFHILMLFCTVFTVICLWNVYHLHVLKLPSGKGVGFTRNGSLQFGCNGNITSSIAMVMVAICMYMITTQRLPLRIVYEVLCVPHLIVMCSTLCRATLGGALILVTGTAFMLGWTSARKLHPLPRAGISLAAAAAGFCLIWFAPAMARALYRFFQRLGGAEPGSAAPAKVLNADLNGRMAIWDAAWKIVTSDFRTFIFGTTNAKALSSLKAILKSNIAHAHNCVIQIAMVMGVPAAEAFLVFLCWILNHCRYMFLDLRHRLFKGAYTVPLMILSFLFVNAFEPYLVGYFSVMGCVFFLLCGLATACRDKDDPSLLSLLRLRLIRRHKAEPDEALT